MHGVLGVDGRKYGIHGMMKMDEQRLICFGALCQIRYSTSGIQNPDYFAPVAVITM